MRNHQVQKQVTFLQLGMLSGGTELQIIFNCFHQRSAAISATTSEEEINHFLGNEISEIGVVGARTMNCNPVEG